MKLSRLQLGVVLSAATGAAVATQHIRRRSNGDATAAAPRKGPGDISDRFLAEVIRAARETHRDLVVACTPNNDCSGANEVCDVSSGFCIVPCPNGDSDCPPCSGCGFCFAAACVDVSLNPDETITQNYCNGQFFFDDGYLGLIYGEECNCCTSNDHCDTTDSNGDPLLDMTEFPVTGPRECVGATANTGGTCQLVGGTPSPSPSLSPDPCDGQLDGTPCEDGDPCTVGDTCLGGICFFGGSPDCSGFDTDCSYGACDFDTGDCAQFHKSSGSSCGDAETECTNQDTCDGLGGCTDNGFKDSLTTCGVAGTECKNQDTCDGAGSCTDNGFVASDTPCGSVVDDVCTDPDTCDGSGTCQPNHEPSGTSCGDPAESECDLSQCNESGVCDEIFAAINTPCGDQVTNTDCNKPDDCSGGGICRDNLESAGQLCDDNNDCTSSDGTAGWIDQCDGGGECIATAVLDGTPCGLTPNSGNQDGVCVGGTCLECNSDDDCIDDPNPCLGRCLSNQCDYTAAKLDNTPCADNNLCNGVETCQGGTCAPGTQVNCDDNNPCTIDGCVTLTGCVNNPAPTTEVCRAQAGPCDVAEYCDGFGSCPTADIKEPNTTECRESQGECDPAEYCDGTSNTCPVDAKKDSSTVCRASQGDCDIAEVCDGTSDNCPADAKSTSECRASAGDCDVAEYCDGTSDTCPADAKEPSTTQCRAKAGMCDVAEYCDGSDNCPTDEKEPTTQVCRSAVDVCDVEEKCDGSSNACPADAFVSAGTECRAAAGDCDVAESCDGLSASCPADELVSSGTECRAAAGDCDIAEVCDGINNGCPADAKKEAGQSCGSSEDTECNNADTCDGSGNCQTNLESAGTSCGDAGTECTNQDTCDGLGGCTDNGFKDSGTSCTGGTCDGAGVCASSTVTKYSCAKNNPGETEICATGTTVACTSCNGKNSCWSAECPDGSGGGPAPTPPAPTSPAPTPPSGCGQTGDPCTANSACCSGNCKTKGKNADNLCT